MVRLARDSLWELLASALRLAAFVTLLTSIFLVLLGQIWIEQLGGVSAVATGSISALYLLSSYRFSGGIISRGETIVLALLYANSFAQSFETVYHFTFPIYLNYFMFPFLTGEEVRYLVFEATMLLPLILVRRYLRVKRESVVLLTLFAVIWAIWILHGFPQYYVDGYYYPRVLITGNPYALGLILNFVSKAILAAFFASLLNLRAKEILASMLPWRNRSGARGIER